MVHRIGSDRRTVRGAGTRPRFLRNGHLRTRRPNGLAHPLGQTLIVTFEREGGPVETVRPGDVAWIAPGEKHWHGAGPDSALTHVAIQESLNGKAADWMEHVTDEQYFA